MFGKRKLESLKEISRRYKNEWLLLRNYKLDKFSKLVKGQVVAHSKNRDDIYREQLKYHEPMAIRYAGPLPKDLVVMFFNV